MTISPFLTDAEILHICAPIKQPAAMVRRLKDMGFHVKPRPNGWPLVSRANYEAVMMGQASSQPANDTAGAGPNVEALLDRYKRNGATYGDGEKTQSQPARAA